MPNPIMMAQRWSSPNCDSAVIVGHASTNASRHSRAAALSRYLRGRRKSTGRPRIERREVSAACVRESLRMTASVSCAGPSKMPSTMSDMAARALGTSHPVATTLIGISR